MSHPTKTLDQWKKLNQLVRREPALASKINQDTFCLSIVVSLGLLLKFAGRNPGSVLQNPERIVPISKAMYFGEPCPFHESNKPNEDEITHAQNVLLQGIIPLRDFILEFVVRNAFVRDALRLFDDLQNSIDLQAGRGELTPVLLCKTWKGTCGLLRDRIWTVVRVEHSTRGTIVLRRH